MFADPEPAADRTPAAADAPDRRVGKRHALVLLVGKVCRAGRDSACLVHDISKFGLMARFTEQPVAGETLRIEVRGLPPIAGTIRWVNGLKAGFAFAEPQDVERVFRLIHDDGMIARAPRFPLAAPARVRLAADPFDAVLIDISPGGAKLTSDVAVEPGQTGQIMLPETGTSIYGTICWTRDARFGFRFIMPLPLATLSRILAA